MEKKRIISIKMGLYFSLYLVRLWGWVIYGCFRLVYLCMEVEHF